jgi:hypothetical protein
MFGQPFYHRTLRKIVVLFGNLFNNLYVVREQLDGTKKEYMKVPLLYAGKEKFITKLGADPELTKSILTTLPRMSFEMSGMAYDPARKQQGLIKHWSANTAYHRKTQYIGVPYTFNFNLSIYVRNIEDGAMIVEQILPYFQPDYTVSATLADELEIVKDIPIILDSVQETVDYEGSMHDAPRMVTWDLTFTMKGWFFGPVSNTAIIMGTSNPFSGVNVNLNQDPRYNQIQTFTFTTGEGDYHEEEEVLVDSRHISAKVVRWSNTSNTLIVSDGTGLIEAGDTIRGITSHTIRVANTAALAPQLLSKIRVIQDPLSAGPEDAYGYDTIITEYPDTL